MEVRLRHKAAEWSQQAFSVAKAPRKGGTILTSVNASFPPPPTIHRGSSTLDFCTLKCQSQDGSPPLAPSLLSAAHCSRPDPAQEHRHVCGPPQGARPGPETVPGQDPGLQHQEQGFRRHRGRRALLPEERDRGDHQTAEAIRRRGPRQVAPIQIHRSQV